MNYGNDFPFKTSIIMNFIILIVAYELTKDFRSIRNGVHFIFFCSVKVLLRNLTYKFSFSRCNFKTLQMFSKIRNSFYNKYYLTAKQKRITWCISKLRVFFRDFAIGISFFLYPSLYCSVFQIKILAYRWVISWQLYFYCHEVNTHWSLKSIFTLI